ncbi:hypothetical protein PENARI_c050G12372 [Penicillium arizonense]|uniref:Uncharacterized protein n=1 Tax=Penicillium arizonense TaxID=1835702 RepID=A0A1F5L2N1_PENAI|nr:hypothetical protein PENARI_c050G12372 [Penicillium arizonense]
MSVPQAIVVVIFASTY